MISRPKRKYNLGPSRRKVQIGAGGATGPALTPIVPTTITHSASTLLVVFPQAVIYSGTLPGWINNAHTVTGVTMTSSTTATLPLSGASAATATTVPFQDPAFRSSSGGYVQPGSYTTA